MVVKRIVPNIQTSHPRKAHKFYAEVLGLDLVMDLGWIRTYASGLSGRAQITVAKDGGAGAMLPDISIEVDDLDGVLTLMRAKRIKIEYGPVDEPWGVRRFFVRDPFGTLLNIVSHTTI